VTDRAIIFTIVVLQVLHSLRIRTHSPLTWDEWYTPFIRRVGFLSLVRLVTAGLPLMDSAMLTTLVDWWRPKTHTFHLPYRKTMMMLQDVAMILGLPIDGFPVCGPVSPAGWRDFIGAAIGIRPSYVAVDQKDKKSSDIHSRMLTTHFDTCPEGAVIQRYAQSCL
jgi:hypothetical protein